MDDITGRLTIQNLNKGFELEGRALKVLEDINLDIQSGEFVALVGASGCGKTTLLRILLGLENAFTGSVTQDGEPILGPSLERGIVFQEHRLLPWLTIEENVAFGLNHGMDPLEKKRRVRDHLKRVGLDGFELAYPGQLSGGMAQRAAIARALVNQPRVLLLDEPLGALDALTRLHMQKELEDIWRAEKVTTLLVTHDIEEAVYLADRVVVLSPRPGRIKREFRVPMSRPRDRDSSDFVAVKDALLAEFQLQAEKHYYYTI
jgi:ABC-type nitrate/sulfonate/bicarbonate transport system ATPase subunit